jgi:hexokinase
VLFFYFIEFTDFGGTNLRCLLLKLHYGKVTNSVSDSTFLDHTMECGETLFSTVADFIISFLKANQSFLTPKPDVLPTGFTFSFPVKQTSISSGTLTRWTKGFFFNCQIFFFARQNLEPKGLLDVMSYSFCQSNWRRRTTDG